MAIKCNTPVVCENEYDENGKLIGQPTQPFEPGSCVDAPLCPDTGAGDPCKPWQLTNGKDKCFINDYVDEALLLGGANINVFKLLGIYEQGKLIDLAENGSAVSGGDQPGFPSSQAFTTFVTEWRSAQLGQDIITSAWVGYNFGEIRLENDRKRYSVDTSIKHNISSIKLKQGTAANNRATKVRVERSTDGIKWFGSAIITLPDDDCFNTIYFRNTAPMRYWRLRPIEFNGGPGDFWAVQAFEMFDYDLTTIDDIQDKIWNENRDREYADESILIKGSYDLIDVQTDLSRLGIELPAQSLSFTVSFTRTVASLGRPIVIGDIFEVPSETQYDVKLNPIKKYMEVTDVAWATEGYTPGWTPLLQRISTQPMLATQETADIVGGLEGYVNSNDGFLEMFDKSEGMDTGSSTRFQDQSDVTQTIEQTACDKDHLPEYGIDPSDLTQFSEEQKVVAEEQAEGGRRGLENIGLNPTQLYVEDGLPPNGLPYTEGDTFPGSPNDGDYHRLTYTGVSTQIPARLFRWTTIKHRWLFMEKDKRSTFAVTKPILQEFLCSPDRIPADDIAR